MFISCWQATDLSGLGWLWRTQGPGQILVFDPGGGWWTGRNQANHVLQSPDGWFWHCWRFRSRKGCCLDFSQESGLVARAGTVAIPLFHAPSAVGSVFELWLVEAAIQPSGEHIDRYEHRKVNHPHVLQFQRTVVHQCQGDIAQQHVDRNTTQRRKFLKHIPSATL